jgi:UrcA family protein
VKKIFVRTSVGLLALIAGAAAGQPVEEITVQASRALNTEIVGRTSSGIPVRDVSLSYRVSLEGLDLASDAGVAELEKRVNDVAEAGCREIGRLYPIATPSDAQCAKAAADKAMVTVRELVAAAREAPAS